MLGKKRVSYLYRTATTAYPCYLPILGEFSRSWSYKTYPLQKYKIPLLPPNNYSVSVKAHFYGFTLYLLNFIILNQLIKSNKIWKIMFLSGKQI